MTRINKLWVERYRPATIDNYVFHDENQRRQITRMIKEREIPHLLLCGIQGSGKTTLSRILVNSLELDDMDVLCINASDENSVDVMRDKIKIFAQGYATGSFKIIQLEEMDYLSLNAQAVLRQVMEDYQETCRFICTCNYANKIMPAIESRCQTMVFKAPPIEDVSVFVGTILMTENIAFDLDELEKYVAASYPDIRKIINTLQQNVGSNKTLMSGTLETTGDYKFKMLDLLEAKDFINLRKTVCDNVTREEFESVYKFMYENIHRCKGINEESAIVIIANYLYKHSFFSDPEINIAAMFIELGRL